MYLFQSFFFWMWLENPNLLPKVLATSAGFNPSSSGCGWKTISCRTAFPFSSQVSILLLLDVAGKLELVTPQGPNTFTFQSFFFWMWLENYVRCKLWFGVSSGFNPSSSGCGWKTNHLHDTKRYCRKFQSFFFWMWLENPYPHTPFFYKPLSFNPSSSGCGWKTNDDA